MGGALRLAGMNMCTGHDVMKELNAVFGDPGTTANPNDRYTYAKANNSFANVSDAPDRYNYRALIAAYSDAGVDVCAMWAAYLRDLARTAEGQHDIYLIAQARLNAMRDNVPMVTRYHRLDDVPHGGPRLQKHDGTGPNDRTTIDAPFTP